MTRKVMGWLACLAGSHQWERGHGYHYILHDSGIEFHQCARCGKSNVVLDKMKNVKFLVGYVVALVVFVMCVYAFVNWLIPGGWIGKIF